jgi:hypothetical protein
VIGAKETSQRSVKAVGVEKTSVDDEPEIFDHRLPNVKAEEGKAHLDSAFGPQWTFGR